MMVASGIAWGIYSLIGKGTADPLDATAGNFLRALPMALAVFLAALALSETAVQPSGLIYAVLSGAIASGLGYAIWYAALPNLNATQGASIQLSVPVLTALLGSIFLGEHVSNQQLLAMGVIIFGIASVILGKKKADMR
ncbi:DMT family transporter [Brucella lupini]|uniref:DMT family transporter n=1 Tax=Brucella lupini TaxID=255457 RepID=A0AB34DE18_9HYPH|nr:MULTISPECIES: DMT family transporter [Brucella]KAB2699476.1 DMT family transporter [Brucella lupini]